MSCISQKKQANKLINNFVLLVCLIKGKIYEQDYIFSLQFFQQTFSFGKLNILGCSFKKINKIRKFQKQLLILTDESVEYLMEEISRIRDNRMMLEKIENSHMENVFKEPQQQQLELNTNTKNLQAYSPPKQKIKDQLDEVDGDLKYVKRKIANFSKWDNFMPYSFAKLPNDEKDHIFQTLFQDFISMKNFYNQYIDKYTKLNTKLHRLENDLSKFSKVKLTGPEKVKVYTEQNKENKELKDQIKRLNQKIIALTSGSKPAQTRPKTGHNQNKTLSMTQQKTIFPVTENLKVELELEKKHVKELLEVIDELRRSKMMVEMELKEKNFSQNVQKINLKPGERPGKSKIGNNSMFNNDDKFKEYTDELLMWKEKAHEMELCYNKMNEDKDRIINEMKRELVELKEGERMRKNLERNNVRPNINENINEARIRELEDTNFKLQSEVRSLLRNPLFKDNTQAVDLKKAKTELQDQVRTLKQELVTVKQQKTKYLAELDLKSKQADILKSQNSKLKRQVKDYIEKEIKSTNSRNEVYKYDQNDYYRKMLNLVKLEGDDPVWKKYSDMVMPVFSVMTEIQLKQAAQSLWKSKLELLAHLEKAQIQLKTNKETTGSKLNIYIKEKQRLQEQLRVTKARLDEWMSMDRVRTLNTRDFQIYQKQGIKYNDSISVFEDQQDELKALQHTENYFDLYLGQLNLDQSNVLRHPQNKIKSISNIISFLTVDFYNHPTQHSHFAQGLSKKLLNNFSYKVQVNSYLVKFLNKNSISIQLWSPQGTSNVQFGKGEIWLSDLLVTTAKDVSNVVRGKCPIYSSNKVLIATVEYRMRMRLPISPFMEWANNKEQLTKYVKSDPFAINQRKKLAITIERAEGLITSGSTFVYFSIQNEDFFTEPCQGSSPFWDYHREIDVVLDDDFCSFLKQNYVQFTLFDDDKEVNEDVVGVAKANLTSLLEGNQPLQLVLDVEDTRASIVGKLKVKAFWA